MVVAWQKAQWKIGAALVALMIAGQAQSLSQWQTAGKQMKTIVAGVDAMASNVREDEYALLLLPDHIGVALFREPPRIRLSCLPPSARIIFRAWR